MLGHIYKLIILTICCNVILLNAIKCTREPEGYGADRTPADGRFQIRIAERSLRYKPDSTYTIMLEGIEIPNDRIRHKFTGFIMAVDLTTNQTTSVTNHANMSYGVFSLMPGDTMTKIACANMVTHTTSSPKSEIRVLWKAPPLGSGCVIFRATVIEHRDAWYMDDGPLSKVFCEDEQANEEFQSLSLMECCACSEAKYEISLEGLWSRNTHPKDFPSNNWLTNFGQIIGATHSIDYKFWQYGDIASNGFRQLVERGDSYPLEHELKNNVTNIRTFIKAPGLSFPLLNRRTFSVFRVDPNRHLVSFVSKIDPSPDWFVGVSGLELCTLNCSWIENKVLDLYPWDAGTDSGPTYISPDQPTTPQDPIRRIKPNYPNDPRSPFFDSDKDYMLPLARLYLTRQRIYPKECKNEDNPIDITDIAEPTIPDPRCALTEWSEFSRTECWKCGVGKMSKTRSYVNGEDVKEICSSYNYHPPLIYTVSCQIEESTTGQCEYPNQFFYYDIESETCQRISLCDYQVNSFTTEEECYEQCDPKRRKNFSYMKGSIHRHTTTESSGWWARNIG